MNHRSPFLCAALLAGALSAQVPTGTLLVVDWFSAGPFGTNQVAFVDPNGGGVTDVFGVAPFGAPPLQGIARSPGSAGEFFCLGPTAGSLTGIQRVPMGPLAVPGVVDGAPWSFPGGERIRIAGASIYTLAANTIASSPILGGAPTTVVTQANAVDIAVDGVKVWIACGSAASPTTPFPLIEHDLATSQQRVVGSYAGVNRVALDPTGPRLLLGTANGATVVDIATGNVLATQPTSVPVVAVCYTLQGEPVFGESGGLGYTVRRLGLAQPLATQSLASLSDIDVAVAATPSVVPFGVGCGDAGPVSWSANGLPQLGNATFQISIAGGPANTLALLFLGSSRTFSSLHGTLPLELTSFGLSGCELRVAPEVPELFPLDGSGSAVYALPIPASPVFAGTEWAAQAFVRDPFFTPYPFAATAGLAFRINP